MKRLILTAATLFALTATAHAVGDVIVQQIPAPQSAEPGSYFIENVPVKQNPYDGSRINQSPIRGAGRISVNHNEPAAGDPAGELTKALWLLKDNNYQCSKR